jgi:hypothetical protein
MDIYICVSRTHLGRQVFLPPFCPAAIGPGRVCEGGRRGILAMSGYYRALRGHWEMPKRGEMDATA